MKTEKQAKKILPLLYGLVLLGSVMLMNVFSINLIEKLNMWVGVLVMASVVIAFICLGQSINGIKDRKYRYIPLLIAAIGSLMLFAVQPIREIGITLDYNRYKVEREAVAQMIVDGKIKHYDSAIYLELPEEYKKLSKNEGGVVVKTAGKDMLVCYFTTRGMWKLFPSLIYVTSDGPFHPNKFNFRLEHVIKLAPHWYEANVSENY